MTFPFQVVYVFLTVFLLLIFSPKPSLADNTAFTIIFTANLNGALDDCGCSDSTVGGFNRLKTILDSLRQQYPNAIVLDGGDFFSSYSQPRLNETVLRIMRRMGYDGIAVGDQELVEGTSIFQSLVRQLPLRIHNLPPRVNFPWIPLTKPLIQSGVRVLAFTDPAAFDFIPMGNLPLLDPLKQAPEVRDAIVVFHGSLSHARQFARRMVDVPLILVGHDQQRGIFTEGHTRLIAVGSDGEFVALVQGTFHPPGKIRVTWIPVTRGTHPDPGIQRLVEEFYQQVK